MKRGGFNGDSARRRIAMSWCAAPRDVRTRAFTSTAFRPVRRLLPAHPHMLRHGCGFKLANDGVDTRALQHYLGHRNIMHTVRYTELRSDRFDGFWKD